MRRCVSNESALTDRDREAIRQMEERVESMSKEPANLRAAAEKLAIAKEFAAMGGIKPPPDAKWSLGWWHEGRFIAVLSVAEALDELKAALEDER